MGISIDEFINKTQGDKSPIFSFMWLCVEAPFGMDPQYIEEVDIPLPSLAQKPLFGAGTFTYYPGFQEISSFNIKVREDVSMRATKWLLKWIETIRDPDTGAYALPSAYKKEFKFELYDTTGSVVCTATARGCWPTTSEAWPLAGNSNEILKNGIAISTDGLKFK